MLVMLVCMLVCSACLSPVLIGAGTLSRWQDPQVIGHRRESCLRSFNLTRASIPVCYMGMEKKKKGKEKGRVLIGFLLGHSHKEDSRMKQDEMLNEN